MKEEAIIDNQIIKIISPKVRKNWLKLGQFG